MLSFLNQRHTKRAYLPRRSIRLMSIALANFPGDILWLCGLLFVRKNFALAMPYLVEQGFSRGI